MPDAPPFFSEGDFHFMGQALAQARQAFEKEEVPAGAIICGPDGKIIARGRNQVIAKNDPTAHAEMTALRKAAKKLGNYRLTGLTLYSTLEPCPMCLSAIIHGRLARLVFGAPEPRWGAAGSVIDLAAMAPANHRLIIEGGLLAEDCRRLMVDFFKARRKGSRP